MQHDVDTIMRQLISLVLVSVTVPSRLSHHRPKGLKPPAQETPVPVRGPHSPDVSPQNVFPATTSPTDAPLAFTTTGAFPIIPSRVWPVLAGPITTPRNSTTSFGERMGKSGDVFKKRFVPNLLALSSGRVGTGLFLNF